jgi:hypothetical protein
MRTAAQIEASKRNGAKSKGPITSEGRARSSQNALRHGLTAHKSVIIDGESKEEWEHFQSQFLVKFQPRDFVEERMVVELAVCRWRLERLWRMQAAVLNQGITNQLPVVEEQYEEFDIALVQACAHSAQKPDLQSLDQLETRLSRRFDRTLRNYNEIRAQFPPRPEPDGDPQPVSEPEIAKLEKEPGARIHAVPLQRDFEQILPSPEPQRIPDTPQPTVSPENSPI